MLKQNDIVRIGDEFFLIDYANRGNAHRLFVSSGLWEIGYDCIEIDESLASIVSLVALDTIATRPIVARYYDREYRLLESYFCDDQDGFSGECIIVGDHHDPRWVNVLRSDSSRDSTFGHALNAIGTNSGWHILLSKLTPSFSCKLRMGVDSYINISEPRFKTSTMITDEGWVKQVYVCSDCGEIIENIEDGYVTADGKLICEDCYDSDYFTCEYCGEIHNCEDAVTVDDEYWCEDCRDLHAHFCDHCEEYHRAYTTRVYVDVDCESEDWCDSCIQNDAIYCESCGDYFDSNLSECPNCAEKDTSPYIHGYHDSHDYDRTFYSIKDGATEHRCTPLDDTVYYGVELEVDKVDDTGSRRVLAEELHVYPFLSMETDCSLNNMYEYSGVEIITEPCTIDYHLKSDMWNIISDAAYKANMRSQDAGTCGLHIHISRKPLRDIEDYEAKVALAIYRSGLCDKWKAISRRHGEFGWCHFKEANTLAQARDRVYDDSHHIAVNFGNDNTIELRFNRGTLNVLTIKSTIWLVDSMVRSIQSGIDVENCTFAELTRLADAPDFVRDYLKSRQVDVPQKESYRMVV